ncbi:MAG TPA: hypothetical protein PLI09_14570 [Candidatus Hydrogenedentes bacterium]|nr:hypothetical protein [Candidatus Hydrogenedentota bacterium]
MCLGRLGQSIDINLVDIRQPFSNFLFVDTLLPNGDYGAVRRLFSLARRGDGKTLILEDIEAVGAVADEIVELSTLFPGYHCDGVKRLTFWKQSCTSTQGIEHLSDEDLLGYAIIKQDVVSDRPPVWHIFESVFRKYPHEHNCVPGEAPFMVRSGNRIFTVNGVMYCQQNGLNKACAQVALRSLLSRILLNEDLPYSIMNQIAGENNPGFNPAEGLDTNQIRCILDHYKILYDDFDYMADNTAAIPYSRILYAGIENSLGGLLGFELSGAGAHGEKHIIPFYGHTFNQDTWVPRAGLAYFHVGENTRYISSEEWLSSFIGHDDNFGSNYCVPRKFLEYGQVKYVVALRPPNTEYGAIEAEAIAVDCLYSTIHFLRPHDNYWIRRLIHHIGEQDVVLRTLCLNRNQYVGHLRECRDWTSNSEAEAILDRFVKVLPEHLWMVEISIPELFSANYRKLGELVLDARVSLVPYPPDEPLWVIARFPGTYLINQSPTTSSTSFLILPSALESHTPLYRG